MKLVIYWWDFKWKIACSHTPIATIMYPHVILAAWK